VDADTIEQRIRPLIAEQLGVEESKVTRTASFVDDLNADSLDLVEMIMSLEEEFKLEITDDEAEKIHTVGDAIDFIQEHTE
jgi:acyl carrier protein